MDQPCKAMDSPSHDPPPKKGGRGGHKGPNIHRYQITQENISHRKHVEKNILKISQLHFNVLSSTYIDGL